MFRPRRPLVPWEVSGVPKSAGVYIIYEPTGGRSMLAVQS
jgi:hypothetical protein